MDNTIGVDAAYQLMVADRELTAKYENKCRQQDWPEKHLQKSPQWALWFTRSVLADRWPAAEPLLSQSPAALENYQQYIELVRSIGMIDHTTGKHEMKRERDDAQYRVTCLQRALRHGNRR